MVFRDKKIFDIEEIEELDIDTFHSYNSQLHEKVNNKLKLMDEYLFNNVSAPNIFYQSKKQQLLRAINENSKNLIKRSRSHEPLNFNNKYNIEFYRQKFEN